MGIKGTEVEAKATPTTKKDLLAAIARALKARTGRDPSRKQLSLIWAQWALETGRGKSCWNYNIGNIRGVSPESKKYLLLPGAYEIIDGQKVITGGSFRAYDSVDEGARDYVSVLFGGLAGGDHGWRALTATENPDAKAFVKGLKDDKYFTADLDEYSKSVDSLSRECMTKTAEGDWPSGTEEPAPTSGNWNDWNQLVDKSRRYDSPCKGARPASIAKPTHIVIHITGTNNFASVKSRFMTAGQASAHYCVDREGNLHQFVVDSGRAWHAGISAGPLALYKKKDGSFRKYKRYFDWSKYPDDAKYYDNNLSVVTDKAKATLVGKADGSDWADYAYFDKRWGALKQPFYFDQNVDPNNYSIGIELLSTGSTESGETYYPEALYQGLDRLLTDLCKKYGIPRDRNHIIGHEDVDPCARWGWDPNSGFDWDRVLKGGESDDTSTPDPVVFSEPNADFTLTQQEEQLYDHLRDVWMRAQKRFGNEGKAEYNFQEDNGRVNLLAARGFDCDTMKPCASTNTKYDDCMFVVYKTKEGKKKVARYACSTEWTSTSADSAGKKADAVILLGQHKYKLAVHGSSSDNPRSYLNKVTSGADLNGKSYRALRPDPSVKITRQSDASKVGLVSEKADYVEDNGTINIHYGGESTTVTNGGLRGWSRGCQVIAFYQKFLEFMKLIESDASIRGSVDNELADKPGSDGTRSLIYTLVEGDFLAPKSAVFPLAGKDADEHYALNEGGEAGFFPIGSNNFWHGGLHLDEKEAAIVAIADGEIVAYRLNKKALAVSLGGEEMKYSNGFVLIRHERYTPKGAKMELFSLAMHLLPWDDHSDEQKKNLPGIFKKHIFTVETKEDGDGKGLNVRKAGRGSEVVRVAAYGDPLTFKTPQTVAPGGKLCEGWHELEDGNWVYVRLGDKPTVKYESKAEPEAFDKVISCKVPVSAGEILGYPGVFFTRPSTVHFEVLTGDIGFMKNPNADKGGTEILQIPPNTKFKKRKVSVPEEIKVDLPTGSLLMLLEQPPGDYRKVACSDIVGWTKRSALGAYDKAKNGYAIEADLATLTSEPGGGASIPINAKKGDFVFYVSQQGDTDRQVRFTLPKAEQEKRTGWALRSALGAWNEPGAERRYKLAAPIAALYKEKPEGAVPTFEEDAGTNAEEIFVDALAATDAQVCKDRLGRVWQEVDFGSGKGWIQIGRDAKSLSPYDWPRWQRIEEAGKYNQDSLCDAPELLKLFDTDKDGTVSLDEIKAALKDPAVAKKLRRIACLHPTEWAGELPGIERLKGPPWNLNEEWLTSTKAYIKELGFWADAAKAGLPAKDQVWHLHPIGFVEHLRLLTLRLGPPTATSLPKSTTPSQSSGQTADPKPKADPPKPTSPSSTELAILCDHKIDGRQRSVLNKERFEVVQDIGAGKDHITLMHRDSSKPSPAALVVTCRGEKQSVSGEAKENGYTQYEFDAPFKGAQIRNFLEGTFWKNFILPTEYKVEGFPKALTVASYRPNKWTLAVDLPVMRGYKAGAKLESETKVAAGPSGFGVAHKKTATLEREITGWKKTTTLTQSKSQSTAVAVTPGQVVVAQQSSSSASLETKKTKKAVEVTCDGKPLSDEVATLNNILGVVAIVSQVLQVLAAIQDKVPQVGWYAEVNVQVLQGKFNLELQMKEYKDYRTYLGIKASIDLVIFAISLEIGVGVSGCGFKAQVFAKVEGSLSVSLSAERVSPEAALALQIPAKLTITGAVGARFEAGNLVKIEGSFETALEIGLTFELHAEKGPSLAGEMKWTGIQGKVGVSVGPGGCFGYKVAPHTFVEEKSLGSFKWPDKPYTPVFASYDTIKSILTGKITEGWGVRVVTPSGSTWTSDKEWTPDEIATKLAKKIDSRKDIRRDGRSIEGLAHDVRQRLDQLGKRDWARDWVAAADFDNFVNKELDKIISASYIDPCKELVDKCK